MTELWTHTTWRVKEGQEDAFIAAWRELVADVRSQVEASIAPTLLRDHDRPSVFVSFAPWSTQNNAVNFRSSDIFRRHLTGMRPLLEGFDAQTLDEVVHG
jgi:heme-degrading monooxygenase HmoA